MTQNNTIEIGNDPIKPANQLSRNKSADWYTPFGRIGDQAGMDYWDNEIASKGPDVAYRNFLTATAQNMASGKGVGADNVQDQKFTNKSADWYTPFGRIGDQAGIDYWNNEIKNKGYDVSHNAFLVAAAQNLVNGKGVGSGNIQGQMPVDFGVGQASANPGFTSPPVSAKNEPVYNTTSMARSSSFDDGGAKDYLAQLKSKYGRYVMGDVNPFANLNSSAAFVSSLMNGAGAGANFSDAQKAEVRYDYMKACQEAGLHGMVNDQDTQWLKLAGQNGYGYTQDSVLDTANRKVFGGNANQADLDVLNYFQQGPDAWKKGAGVFEGLADKYGASPQMRAWANEMGYTPLQTSGAYSNDPYQDMQKRIETYGSLNPAQQSYLQQQLQGLSSAQRQQMQQFFPQQQGASPQQQTQQQNPYLQPFQQAPAYNQALNTNWASFNQPKASQYWGQNSAQQEAINTPNGSQNFPAKQSNGNQFPVPGQQYNNFSPSWENPYQNQSPSWGQVNQSQPYNGGFQNNFQQTRGLLNQGSGQQQPANSNQNRYGLLSAYGSR